MEILGIIGSIASILGLIWGVKKIIKKDIKGINQKNNLCSIFNSGNIKQEIKNKENENVK